jgi:hypothetical protein
MTGCTGVPAAARSASARRRLRQISPVTAAARSASMPRVLLSTKQSGEASVSAAVSVSASQRVSSRQPWTVWEPVGSSSIAMILVGGMGLGSTEYGVGSTKWRSPGYSVGAYDVRGLGTKYEVRGASAADLRVFSEPSYPGSRTIRKYGVRSTEYGGPRPRTCGFSASRRTRDPVRFGSTEYGVRSTGGLGRGPAGFQRAVVPGTRTIRK